jgi:hypothetical protein
MTSVKKPRATKKSATRKKPKDDLITFLRKSPLNRVALDLNRTGEPARKVDL